MESKIELGRSTRFVFCLKSELIRRNLLFFVDCRVEPVPTKYFSKIEPDDYLFKNSSCAGSTWGWDGQKSPERLFGTPQMPNSCANQVAPGTLDLFVREASWVGPDTSDSNNFSQHGMQMYDWQIECLKTCNFNCHHVIKLSCLQFGSRQIFRVHILQFDKCVNDVEPEESRLSGAQNTCRPCMCKQYICTVSVYMPDCGFWRSGLIAFLLLTCLIFWEK